MAQQLPTLRGRVVLLRALTQAERYIEDNYDADDRDARSARAKLSALIEEQTQTVMHEVMDQ